jgi:hypothetical protein
LSSRPSTIFLVPNGLYSGEVRFIEASAALFELKTDLGNHKDFFDRRGWGFHDHIIEHYAPVVKLHGPLGVCTITVALVYGHGLTSHTSPGCCTFMTPKL